MSAWTEADGVTPLPFQDGDRVKFRVWDRGRDLAPFTGWVRRVEWIDGAPTFGVFYRGQMEWTTAGGLVRIDMNPHPGREHTPAFCANCGY